eukprot:s612_g35.t1
MLGDPLAACLLVQAESLLVGARWKLRKAWAHWTVPGALAPRSSPCFFLSCRGSVLPSNFLSRSAVEMGCTAGCANSSVHEPELKGSKEPKGHKVQHHKMHKQHKLHKHKQRKADFVDLKSMTSKSMMTEDPPFRSMFEGVGGPGPVLYQPYLGIVQGKPVTCGNAQPTAYAQPVVGYNQPAYGYQQPTYQPAYGQPAYGQPAYGQHYGQPTGGGGGGMGGGMAVAGAGLAGLAGGFLAAELLDDVF